MGGLRGVSCDNFDSSEFTFFGDHGKLIMQSKWGNDFCITAWLTNDDLLPNYVDIGACRDEEDGVVDKALMRSVLSGSFSASWSQSFEYDQSTGHIKVLSNNSIFNDKCISLDSNNRFQLADCAAADTFGRRIDDME